MIGVYFEPIVPEPFNDGVIRLYMLNEGRKILTEMKRDFERTVKTWDKKPKFKKKIGFGTTELRLSVFTEDENYARVSEGTTGKPRVARGMGLAVDGKPKALTIISYTAKSPPGTIDARAGGYDEGAPRFLRKYALEAGKIEPRKFDDLIFEIWEEDLPERLQEAMNAAALKTGYAF